MLSLIKLQRLSFVVLFARAIIILFSQWERCVCGDNPFVIMTRNDAFFPGAFCIATKISFVQSLTICPLESRAHLLQTIFVFVALETQSVSVLLQINLGTL